MSIMSILEELGAKSARINRDEGLMYNAMATYQDINQLLAFMTLPATIVDPMDERRVRDVVELVIEGIQKDLGHYHDFVNRQTTRCPTVALVATKAQNVLSLIDEFSLVAKVIADRLR